MTGYSDASLWKKLGYKTGLTCYLDGTPDQYLSLLSLPVDVEVSWLAGPESDMKFVHLFVSDTPRLKKKLESYRRKIALNRVIWYRGPRKLRVLRPTSRKMASER
jgi:hypothetical protein